VGELFLVGSFCVVLSHWWVRFFFPPQ
jgi:hypothetical protein